jgi:hypothetical protein
MSGIRRILVGEMSESPRSTGEAYMKEQGNMLSPEYITNCEGDEGVQAEKAEGEGVA